MRFIVLSDMHGDTAYLEKIGQEVAAADGILFGGDFARFEAPQTAEPSLRALLAKNENLFAVTGNCDDPSFVEVMEAADVCVQGGLLFRDGLFFAGSGGALTFTGSTPNERSDEELVSDLRLPQDSPERTTWPNLIAIIHQPPKDTACDIISAGIHVGSPGIRQFIEEVRPLAVITGHIHESAAVDHLGDTLIMNPGSLAEGRYGLLEVAQEAGQWKVVSAQLKDIPSD